MYYDTGVWVAYMLGDKDDYYPVCKPLIENIETRKKIAIVSYLTIMETIHALRRRIVEKSDFTGDSKDECRSKIPIVKNVIKEFIRRVNELSKQKKIIIPRPSTKISEHHSTALKKLNNYFGRVRPMNICPYCKKCYVGRNAKNECISCNNKLDSINVYQYKGLGHADIEHAFLAHNSNTTSFYSTDTSFNDLKGDPDFGSMSFKIIPHPSRITQH